MLTKQQIKSFKEDYNIYKNLRRTSYTKEELYKRISIRNWQTEEFNNLKESIVKYGVGNRYKKIWTTSYWFGQIFRKKEKIKIQLNEGF